MQVPAQKIETFTAFLAKMRTSTNTKPAKYPQLEAACLLMWEKGILVKNQIARECDLSHQTASKWVDIAKALGLKQGERRTVDGAYRSKDAQNLYQPKLPDSQGPPPELNKTTEEIRRDAIAWTYHDMATAHSPEQRAKSLEALTKVAPNLKVPEVSVQLQTFIGDGSADKLSAAIRESIDLLLETPEDREELLELFGRDRLHGLLAGTIEADYEEVPNDATETSEDGPSAGVDGQESRDSASE